MFYDEEEGRPLLKEGFRRDVSPMESFESIPSSSSLLHSNNSSFTDVTGENPAFTSSSSTTSSSYSSSQSSSSPRRMNLSSLPVTCTIAILFLMSFISCTAYFGPSNMLRSVLSSEKLIAADFQQQDASGLVALQAEVDAVQTGQPIASQQIAAPVTTSVPQGNTAPIAATTSALSTSNSTESQDQIDPPDNDPVPIINNNITNSSIPENEELEDPTENKDVMENVTSPDTNPTPPIPTTWAPTAEPTAAMLHFHLPDAEEIKKALFPGDHGSRTTDTQQQRKQQTSAGNAPRAVQGSSFVSNAGKNVERSRAAAATLFDGANVARNSDEVTDPTTVSASEEPEGGEEPPDQYEITDSTPVESADEPEITTNTSSSTTEFSAPRPVVSASQTAQIHIAGEQISEEELKRMAELDNITHFERLKDQTRSESNNVVDAAGVSEDNDGSEGDGSATVRAGNATSSASAGNETYPSLESMAVSIGEDMENVIVKPIESTMGMGVSGNATQLLSVENPTMEPTGILPPPAISANLDPDADIMRKGSAKLRINSISNSLFSKRV